MTLDLQTEPRTALTVRPGDPLSGTVRVDGSKNAALPLLAAAAAVHRPIRLTNVPHSTDVRLMLALLQQTGSQLAASLGQIVISPGLCPVPAPDLPQAARIRASYYLVPALLSRFGSASLPWPGGCRIGNRGMDLHFAVYEAFGDEIRTDVDGYQVRAAATAAPVTVQLPFRSRGASVCAVLRAVAGGRRLRLENPNLSPEFTGMLDALRTSGHDIGLAPDAVTVEPSWSGATGDLTWAVPGDKIEAGTIAAAIAATGGHGRVKGVNGSSLARVVEALNCLGVAATIEPEGLVIAEATDRRGGSLSAVASLDPGGLDADFEPALMALALGFPGQHVFGDDINPGRHGNLVPQLARLGAVIEQLSSTRCRLSGPQQLTGAAVEATDIRTGSALLIAGLTASGETTISGLEQLRRGHPNLPGKLRWLGAEITGDEQ